MSGWVLSPCSWDVVRVLYSTYDLDAGASPGLALHPSSDFSWCAVDKRDDSVHVVNTIRLGGGITYRYLRDGAWSPPEDHAVAEVTGVDDADHVGPTIDIDSDGFKYVAFAGRDRIPYYLVIAPDGQSLGVTPLDAVGGSVSGGKYENPNVGVGPGRRGSFVAWGATQVFVRGIGLAGTQKRSDSRFESEDVRGQSLDWRSPTQSTEEQRRGGG